MFRLYLLFAWAVIRICDASAEFETNGSSRRCRFRTGKKESPFIYLDFSRSIQLCLTTSSGTYPWKKKLVPVNTPEKKLVPVHTGRRPGGPALRNAAGILLFLEPLVLPIIYSVNLSL